MATNHIPNEANGGRTVPVREARDNRSAQQAGADARRIARDSFAVDAPNRPSDNR